MNGAIGGKLLGAGGGGFRIIFCETSRSETRSKMF